MSPKPPMLSCGVILSHKQARTCVDRNEEQARPLLMSDSIIATRTINAEVPQFNWILLIQKTLSRWSRLHFVDDALELVQEIFASDPLSFFLSLYSLNFTYEMSSLCSSFRILAPQWRHKNVRFFIFLHSKKKTSFVPSVISSSASDDSVPTPKQSQVLSLSHSTSLAVYHVKLNFELLLLLFLFWHKFPNFFSWLWHSCVMIPRKSYSGSMSLRNRGLERFHYILFTIIIYHIPFIDNFILRSGDCYEKSLWGRDSKLFHVFCYLIKKKRANMDLRHFGSVSLNWKGLIDGVSSISHGVSFCFSLISM